MGDSDVGMPKLSKILPNVTSMIEATNAILAAITHKLAVGLGIPVDDVDLSRPLHTYGVDSLVAVELRDWVWRDCRTQLSVFDLLSPEPLQVLAEKVAAKSELIPKEAKGE